MKRPMIWILSALSACVFLWCQTRSATALDEPRYGPPPLPAPSATTQVTGGPKLVLDQDTFDWGETFQGEDPRHRFVVRNDGDKPLIINNVKPG